MKINQLAESIVKLCGPGSNCRKPLYYINAPAVTAWGKLCHFTGIYNKWYGGKTAKQFKDIYCYREWKKEKYLPAILA
ncbi:MAG TPA: hypothetical protein VG738_14610 [Chitinophagaceae bacterium]|nr:hypothetical protein [Chitinophagaceae bacterium]